jgi:hypothetical protein
MGGKHLPESAADSSMRGPHSTGIQPANLLFEASDSGCSFGWIAKSMGFNASFIGLAIVAVAGGVFFQTRMPETKVEEQEARKAAVSA